LTRWLVRTAVAFAAIVLVVAVVEELNGEHSSPSRPPSQGTLASGLPIASVPADGSAAGAPAAGTPVCGQPVLDSPWHYDGVPGIYSTSGSPAGLPTFGTAGTDFPSARSVIVVAAGDNTFAARSGNYNVNNTVVYFEPGVHRIRGVMYTGHNSAYVGGYTAAAGKAILDGVDGATDGTGKGGSFLAYSTPSSGNNVYDTWKYLTIRNYTASQNNSIMGNVNGGGSDNGDVYEYDTIGPNEYGYRGSNAAPGTGKSSGGGYAINAGSNTMIQHNCLTWNAQGAFNASGAVNLNIAHNEISWNGLGEYPDTGDSPGASPYACGCSGGGKIFFSLNTNVAMNYIHDNYNAGIWFDFDNAGADITRNYIASNWGSGIVYEASYNAHIADNTLVGNGWASHGPWPAGVDGRACYGGISCTDGDGPVTGAGGGNPYAAIDLSNSGGNSHLSTVSIPASTSSGCSSPCAEKSRYIGRLLVQDNVLTNNFGGVKVYTDTNRYPGNLDDDSACSFPLGVLDQSNSTTYYQQSRVLFTDADTAISGSEITTADGTKTICADYGKVADDGPGTTVQAPSAGMGVYDQNSGAFLGTVATVISAKAFTLSRSPGNRTGSSLLLSAYGGCGPADYYGGQPGMSSGHPPADYWDNCIWGSRNVTVSGNRFSIDAEAVAGCDTVRNLCGYMSAVAFNAGVPALMKYWDMYVSLIAASSGGLGNVWSDNIYQWSGGGPGGWQFQAGTQGNQVTRAQWQGSRNGQDAGSSFG
jgi:Right handed beta helix region